MRQLVDANSTVTLTQSYAPYGEVTQSVGNGATAYQFTGEMRDSYIKLIYLRSRYYAPGTGRFLTKDSWQGDYNKPLSLNRWGYVEGNPVIRVDPTGMCYTDTRPWTRGFWERFFEKPILGPCSSNTLQPSAPPTSTPSPTNTPEPISTTCPPTIIPTPTPAGNWFTFPDNWTISYYVTALEWDPYFLSSGPYASGLEGYLPGLDETEKYNLNWAYSDRGVQFQGQGLSNGKEYITKDWTRSVAEGTLYFKYGKGGQHGHPRAWETVATGSTRLWAHAWVKIAIHPEMGPFEVLDTGEYVGESHLDVFIGDELISTANGKGTPTSKISVLLP